MHKIVHIARPFTGVGVYISLLVEHINNEKFENHLFCNKENETSERHHEISSLASEFHIDLIRPINIIRDFKCLLQIVKHLKKVNPDIIHSHSAKAGILGRIAGAYLKIPTLYTPHAFSYLSAQKRSNKILYKSIERFFNYFPSKTLTCSNSEYNRVIHDLKFNKEKVLIWNNSIDDIANLPIIDEETFPKDFICSIGRVSYQKNIEMLLGTIEQIKKTNKRIHLVIIGVGSDNSITANIRALITKKNLSDNISLIPWLDRGQIISVLRKSFLYVSSSRYEGLPYAVIEALSLSKPCVVTNVDGNKDLIIEGYNGFLIEENNCEDMAKKIISIFEDNKIYESMCKNARNEFVNKYNIRKNIKDLERIYLSEIKGR